MLTTILLLIALVLFLLAAFGVNLGRAQSGWLGLAVLAFSMLLPALGT